MADRTLGRRNVMKNNRSHTCRVATPIENENRFQGDTGTGVDARTTTGLHPNEYKSFVGDPGLEPGATGFGAIFREDPSVAAATEG